MSIKLGRRIAEEMNSRGPISVPDGCITGEEYEEWLYKKSCEKGSMKDEE